MSDQPINSHIIPQHHLRQFTNDVGCIFTYSDYEKHTDKQCISKGGGRVVRNTASEEGYYSSKIEQFLNRNFEREGSGIANKILQKQSITLDERKFFVRYIASFMYRVPYTENLLQNAYPEVLERMQSFKGFMQFRNRSDSPAFNEVDYFNALKDPNLRDKIVKQTWENSIEDKHQLIYEALLVRDWWVAEVTGSEYFITSNNPIHYSRTTGMADINVQITFPLSQTMAIVFDGVRNGSPDPSINYCLAGIFLHNQVDLINVRTANNSTYLYSPKRDPYVQSLLERSPSEQDQIRRGVLGM